MRRCGKEDVNEGRCRIRRNRRCVREEWMRRCGKEDVNEGRCRIRRNRRCGREDTKE